MKFTLSLSTIWALALTASAGPTPTRYENLPGCAFRCWQQHALPLVGIVNGAWEYCQMSGGIGRNPKWHNLGEMLDKCKIEHCKTVDEWWDAADWHYTLCGDHYRTKGSLAWFNGYRKSGWWPDQGPRSTWKADHWIEGVHRWEGVEQTRE